MWNSFMSVVFNSGARMKLEKETYEEVKQRRVNKEISDNEINNVVLNA